MQLRPALNSAIETLEQHDVGSPRMNAEMLLMFVLDCNRAYLYAHPERELTGDELQRYGEALAERARGVPAQYITGHQEFWGLDFIVSPAVLIPRPETEHVVEAVLDLARPETAAPWRIADVGTGSGCIAIALASELPHAEIIATDISAAALDIARANAARLGFDRRVTFLESDLLAGISGVSNAAALDFVVSNPPYVATSDAATLAEEVGKHEPHLALFAGERGLDVYARLIPEAERALKPGGWLV